MSGNWKKKQVLFCFYGDRLGILKEKDSIDFNGHDLMDPKKKSIDAASRCIFYIFAQSLSGKASPSSSLPTSNHVQQKYLSKNSSWTDRFFIS